MTATSDPPDEALPADMDDGDDDDPRLASADGVPPANNDGNATGAVVGGAIGDAVTVMTTIGALIVGE